MTAPVIDRAARERLATLLTKSLQGELTIRAYDDVVWSLDSEDPAIRAIRSRIWSAYDDFTSHSRDMRSLHADAQATVRRCILFLRSDRPYLWPRKNFASLLTLLRWVRPVARRLRMEKEGGDWEAWPFFSRTELPRP